MKNAGVYQISNYATDEIFIGSARNIRREEIKIFEKLQKRKCKYLNLQESYNLYGYNMFGFECLQSCKSNELKKINQYYINLLSPELNRKEYNIIQPEEKSEIQKPVPVEIQSVRAKRIMNLLQIRIKVFNIILSITINRR